MLVKLAPLKLAAWGEKPSKKTTNNDGVGLSYNLIEDMVITKNRCSSNLSGIVGIAQNGAKFRQEMHKKFIDKIRHDCPTVQHVDNKKESQPDGLWN